MPARSPSRQSNVRWKESCWLTLLLLHCLLCHFAVVVVFSAPSPHQQRGYLDEEESLSSSASSQSPDHNSTNEEVPLPSSEQRLFGLPNNRDEHEPSLGRETPPAEKSSYSKWAFLQRTAEALRSPSPDAASDEERSPSEKAEEIPQRAIPRERASEWPAPMAKATPDVSPSSPSYVHDAEEASGANVIDDDRTLLDLFAESAKEYLTTRMIPPTDPECRWDWRYMQCEPACHCSFQHTAGDYHLGRSCRLVPEEELVGGCRANSEHILDQPVPKRFLSLVGQTSQILLGKSTRALLRVQAVQQLQHEVCDELWSGVRSERPRRTIPERLLCGPVTVPECPDEAQGPDVTT